MFKPKGPYCQSCGMPPSKDAKGGGREADRTRSSEFCGHRYAGGRFTKPNITTDEMVGKVIAKMKEMRFPGFLARRFAKDIPQLRRWTAQPTAAR